MISNSYDINNLKAIISNERALEKEKSNLMFIKESNAIEKINREPTKEEIEEFERFMKLKKISISQILKFISVYQPNAKIRTKAEMDVKVGSYHPPKGGPKIKTDLENLLKRINDITPFQFHCEYEKIHPFTDCNGRSGRMIWAWKMKDFPLGFLHSCYLQSLNHKAVNLNN